jgi:hypothetical protein
VQAKAVEACSSAELAALGLAPPPWPCLAVALPPGDVPVADRLHAVQQLINALQYNHSGSGQYNYCVNKKRPLQAILLTAAAILQQPLPIKCIGEFGCRGAHSHDSRNLLRAMRLLHTPHPLTLRGCVLGAAADARTEHAAASAAGLQKPL